MCVYTRVCVRPVSKCKSWQSHQRPKAVALMVVFQFQISNCHKPSHKHARTPQQKHKSRSAGTYIPKNQHTPLTKITYQQTQPQKSQFQTNTHIVALALSLFLSLSLALSLSLSLSLSPSPSRTPVPHRNTHTHTQTHARTHIHTTSHSRFHTGVTIFRKIVTRTGPRCNRLQHTFLSLSFSLSLSIFPNTHQKVKDERQNTPLLLHRCHLPGTKQVRHGQHKHTHAHAHTHTHTNKTHTCIHKHTDTHTDTDTHT